MFISKINTFELKKKTFKGYQHERTNGGENVLRFNFPFDTKNKKCRLEIYEVEPDATKIGGYRVLQDKMLLAKDVDSSGVVVDLQSETNLGKEAPFAYRFKVDNNYIADTGMRYVLHDNDGNMHETEFTLVSRNGTIPVVQGAGVLTMPDIHRPGAEYYPYDSNKTGKIHYDELKQKKAEQIVKTYSNKIGGTLAGIEHDIPELKKMGVKVLFSTPITGGDNVTAHHYHNKNNKQISDDIGNIENMKTFARKLFKNGMKFVYDGTFTSEGLEGIHFQYALRWADQNPQSYYWFRMDGLKSKALGFGVVPANAENLRHRAINPPVVYDEQLKRVVKNPKYDPNKETYFQIYDGSQVSNEQEACLDRFIGDYQKALGGNSLDINTYEDTIINYVLEVDPKDYEKSLKNFEEYNKKLSEPILPNSSEGTMVIARFPYFTLGRDSSGTVEWDSNRGLFGMNYHIAGIDEKNNQSYVEDKAIALEQAKQKRGAIEVQDMSVQLGRYWTRKFRDIQTLLVAQTLKGVNNSDGIKELIKKGELPEEAYLNDEAIENVKFGLYAPLESKGVLEKDDVTVRALMKLPLDSLEFAENTVGVLSTSYFSNLATEEDQIGMTRFELMKENNPHLIEEYAHNYIKMNHIYEHELKNFADEVIKSIDEKSQEKLLDSNGEYTEYGEYVIELFGGEIAKFALLKSLAGDKLKSKILENGDITYDYISLKKDTTLKSLGIQANNPREEATQLRRLITRGLDKLTREDISKLSDAISRQIKGTSLTDFRLAEAIILNAGLGLDWRADACKDVIHMDSTRMLATSFDESWRNAINFWKRFVKAVKAENPTSYTVAEITDVDKLMRQVVGEKISVYEKVNPGAERFRYKTVQDAMMQFFNQTGMTSEAGYSYTFTDILKVFSPEFEQGTMAEGDYRNVVFLDSLKKLLKTRSIDYTRNLYTFADNHDKASVLHGMSLDMGLFHHSLSILNAEGAVNYDANRYYREEVMKAYSNSDSWDTMPLEAKLNIDNPEYFINASTKAVAMHNAMRSAINELDNDIADAGTKQLLKDALVDLMNGNYLGVGRNSNMVTVETEALKSFENALREILSNANLELSQEEFNQVIGRAYDRELIDRYSIRGDFNWNDDKLHKSVSGETYGQLNTNRAEWILKGANQSEPSGENNYMQYSLYTLSFACILAEAFERIRPDKKSEFLEGAKDFLKKYNRETVEAERKNKITIKSLSEVSRSNGFAVRDFETVIRMIIEQAEYKAVKSNVLKDDEHLKNTDAILTNIFRKTTEPAVQKALMYATYLVGYPGLCVTFIRDMLGSMGYEEKTKNLYLQDRNAVLWSQLEDGPLKDYRKEILSRFTEVLQLRSKDGAEAINNGTPYLIKTSDSRVPAILFQDGFGDVAISVFNATDVNPYYKYDYHAGKDNVQDFINNEYVDVINPNNKYVPIQKMLYLNEILLDNYSLKEGMELRNLNLKDTATYVVKRLADGAYAIVNKNGGKIALNGTTAKNGVMILVQKVKNKPVFLGRPHNIVTNPYQAKEQVTNGEKLAILNA